MIRPPVNDAQRQLLEQSARNLADEAHRESPEPTESEIAAGRFAYAAYGAESGAGDKTWDGRPMPTWDEMQDRQRAGWIAVGRAFAASYLFEGVSAVRVRVTEIEHPLITVESTSGEHFTGSGYIDPGAPGFLAVGLPGKRNGVVRLAPFTPAVGVETDGVLLS